MRYLCSNKSIHSSVLVFATGALIALAAAESGAVAKDDIESKVKDKVENAGKSIKKEAKSDKDKIKDAAEKAKDKAKSETDKIKDKIHDPKTQNEDNSLSELFYV